MLSEENTFKGSRGVSSVMSQGHQGICEVFASGRYCRFGKHCRYLHFRKPPSLYQSEYHEDGVLNTDTGTSRSSSYSTNFQFRETVADHGLHNVNRGVKGRFATNTSNRKSEIRRCRYFNNGHCSKGDKCVYLHEVEGPSVGSEGTDSIDSENRQHEKKEEKQKEKGVEVAEKDKLQTCQFFAKGVCRYGRSCRFKHDKSNISTRKAYADSRKHQPPNQRSQHKFTYSPDVVFNYSDLNPEKVQEVRDKEIAYLKNRYPRAEVVSDGIFKFIFRPSDPDWEQSPRCRFWSGNLTQVPKFWCGILCGINCTDSNSGQFWCGRLTHHSQFWCGNRHSGAKLPQPYDVKTLNIHVGFPTDYPLKPLTFTLPENDQLPETVQRYLWKSLEEWVVARFKEFEDKGRAELVLRAALRWLDRNIQEMFTDGLKAYQKELIAKAAGIEFIPASQLREEFAKRSSGSESEGVEEEDEDESYEEDSDDDIENDPLMANPNHSNSLDAAKRGTEVKLQQLQLKEKAASLMAERVKIIVQCGRCKNKTEFETPPGRINVFSCMKCNAEQLATFRVNMAHQFTTVIGYLDLKECIIHDMILSECVFKVGCMECDREMNFGGVIPGQLKETWCHSCHSKLVVAAECAKFLNLQQAEIDLEGAQKLDIKKTKKIPKDPAIKEGHSLPNEGACKHYKKSFRWLRFPCCGKAYPCDVCHDDNEDHEAAWAGRMICGFCCKEQPFAADKPCKACHSSLTKQSSSHWEGGKGCRDKIKMSCNDDAKYKGMSKTTSRKQQAKSSTTKKTKLRHA